MSTLNIVTAAKERLGSIQLIEYVDENWGQLDYYSPNFPVKWPCALVDTVTGRFTDNGPDRQNIPVQRQQGEVMVEITVANLRLTNSSSKAPDAQKSASLLIHTVMNNVHVALHGWSPGGNMGKFMRVGFQKEKRDDGVQEYKLFYSIGLHDC